MRRTKIVCTLGPASSSVEVIDQLVAAGMDCARLNFSHGDHAQHAEMARKIREAAGRARRPLAILADLCGPKMRVGRFAAGSVELEEGQAFTLTTEKVDGDATRVSVSYPALPQDAKVDDTILLDDGLLRLRVTGTSAKEVQTEVEIGGTLSDRKGLNLPGVELSIPALTKKDREDLRFAVDELKVDFVALSFVRRASDIEAAKELAGGTPIIAKIEKPEAVENLEAILDAADGAMVARGDLGVELGSEKVPLVQKRIIRETNDRGKIVITATQMLDSMIRNPRPTRAEAADVANAVMDGTDAVMLSGETAAGKYPVKAVEMMDLIAREVESEWVQELSRMTRDMKVVAHEDWEFPEAAARAAAVLSTHLPLAAIVSFTQDGRSAGLLAEFRPRAPIVAITHRAEVAQRLALEWGVVPRLEVPPEDLDETLRIACALLAREKLAKKGEPFAMIAGWPTSGRTNTVKLHRL
ncbi:MAG: pyruvate kinase [Sandaracinus sp.]|nr:pyruvate kinase [Sandaracinus sp.]|tara:strand:+ start:231 stop:1640 length:1410 start_codon:yes stop_codon:yes gene_type:complete